jgi:hypothetical protein
VAWRNGSCLASDDCKLHNSISTFTYSNGFGFWVNTICCRGHCQELTPLSTHCYQKTLGRVTKQVAGRHNHNVGESLPFPSQGWGSQDLCSTLAVIQEHPALLGHQLSHRPDCSTSHRATLGSQCHSGAVPGLQLALPILVVALGATVLS